jgi:lipopolysaccharide/colanic/teichoic acid biosynthesis glycosyltransferase
MNATPILDTSAAEASAREPLAERSRGWPATRLAAWSTTLALAIAVIGPAAVGRGFGFEWLLLVTAGIAVTAAAKALYEACDRALGRPGARHHLIGAGATALLSTAAMGGASALTGVGDLLPVRAAVTAVLTVAALVTAGVIRDAEIRTWLGLRRVYFVGSPASQQDLEQELAHRRDARLVGAQPAGAQPRDAGLVGTVLDSGATVLVLDAEAMRSSELVDAASRLRLAGLRIRDLVDYYEGEFKKVPLSELSPTWFLFDIAPIHRRGIAGAVRRVLETALATGILVISLPALLLAGAAIRLTSPGPALYRQRRVGKGGAQFTLLKLRTMVASADGDAAWAPSQAARVTTVGRFLRRFRVDELPQLWNVIRGELALIGPRPEQVPIVERLDRELPYYSARHCIRPGITGWAQVTLGYAGSPEGTVAKLQRDLWYIKHSCLRLDALIIWLTIKTVIAGRG